MTTTVAPPVVAPAAFHYADPPRPLFCDHASLGWCAASIASTVAALLQDLPVGGDHAERAYATLRVAEHVLKAIPDDPTDDRACYAAALVLVGSALADLLAELPLIADERVRGWARESAVDLSRLAGLIGGRVDG